MPRKKLKISHQHIDAAKQWIVNKLNRVDFPYLLKEANYIKKNHQAKTAWENLPFDEPDALNEWCEQYLSTQQWNQLKNAIRASHLRENRKQEPSKRIKRVDLEEQAHLILFALAKRDGITLSETVIKHMKSTWETLPRDQKYPPKN